MIENNVVLTGFMGVGKTTSGELAALKLGWTFVDIDSEIELSFGMPVKDIFKEHGEQAFRSYEKSVIEAMCRMDDRVISLGGGAFMDEETRTNCLSGSTVIFLEMSWDSWKARLEDLKPTRPILHSMSEEEVKELFEARRSFYAHHHFSVQVDGLSAEEVADRIVELAKAGY